MISLKIKLCYSIYYKCKHTLIINSVFNFVRCIAYALYSLKYVVKNYAYTYIILIESGVNT